MKNFKEQLIQRPFELVSIPTGLQREISGRKPAPIRPKSFLLHLRPGVYRKDAVSFRSTYYLGFLAMFFFFLELITGVFLMVYYSPTPAGAYQSIVKLTTQVPYGWLVRDLHRLGGECMIVVVVMHMAWTFYKGAYTSIHRFTWVTGVFLLLFTLMLGFTGYLLPWDQLSYWAVTIGTSIADEIPAVGPALASLLRGGAVLGADGLLRFYLLHIFGVPCLMAIVLAVHYYRITRLRMLSQSLSGRTASSFDAVKENLKIPLLPTLVLQELVISLGVLLGLIVVVSFFYSAPLGNHADPFHTPVASRAPWFFLWLQGGLKLGDSFIMGVCLPAGFLIVVFLFPYCISTGPGSALPRLFAAGLLFVLLVGGIVLSILGLPGSGLHKSTTADIFQRIAPEEGKSIFHQIGFDNLPAGLYETVNQQDLQISEASFADWFISFLGDVESFGSQDTVKNARGVVIVEDWQADLRRVTVRIHWLLTAGSDHAESSEIQVFVHRYRSLPFTGGT